MHHEEITIAVFIVRDEKGRTPYAVAGDKETRNEFRRFMACHPDRYDYVKAQVCFVKSPLSPVILLLYHERGKSTHETVQLTWLPKLILANRRMTVNGTFYSNTLAGFKHDIFDHVVSSFVNFFFKKTVHIREDFNSPRNDSDIDMAACHSVVL